MTMKRRRRKAKLTPILVRVDSNLLQALDVVARRFRTSRAAAIRAMVENTLNLSEATNAPAE